MAHQSRTELNDAIDRLERYQSDFCKNYEAVLKLKRTLRTMDEDQEKSKNAKAVEEFRKRQAEELSRRRLVVGGYGAF